MEAMALGLPVIASDVGATRQIVEDGRTGYVITPKTPQLLASKILELIEKRELRKSMGENGRRKYLNQYSFVGYQRRLQRILHAIQGIRG